MNKQKKLTFLIVLLTGIFFSCPDTTPPSLTPSPPPGTEEPGGIVTPPARVSGVTIRRLEFTDRIRLTWAASADAESYKIYRYTEKEEAAYDRVFSSPGNVFEDTKETAVKDTPYYYKVSAVAGGVESEKSANFTEGIYSTLQTDNYEPNDDILQAQEIKTGTFTALIYSFNQGRAQDRDWYKFSAGTGTDFYTLKITLPADSPLTGKLCVTVAGSSEKITASYETTINVSGTLYFSIDFRITNPDCDSLDYYILEWSEL